MSFFPQLLNYLTLRLNEDHHHHRRHNTDTTFDIQQLENRQLFAADLPGFDVNDGVLYQLHGTNGDQGQLSTIDLVNDSYNDIGENAGFKINAAGFNVNDGLIYGMVRPSNELIAIGADGSHEIIGEVANLPDGNYFTGDFAQDGLLYVRHGNKFYGINVDTASVENTITAVTDVRKIYDIALNPVDGLHYAIRKNGANADFISIDLRNGSTQGHVNVINNDLRPAGTYGAMFADATGRVFAANNRGGFYEIDVQTGEATFAGYSPRATSNDGAFSNAASINLPAVAFNEWFSTLAGTSATDMNLTTPYDLDGDELTITVSELPTAGEIQLADGSAVVLGQELSIADFEGLRFDATNVVGIDTESGSFVYEVLDGTTTTEGRADINVAGLSRIEGQVIVNDDTEDGVYQGYEYNVTISLSGTDFQGNQVDLNVDTDIYGNFVFDDIAPGTYQLDQAQPNGVYDSYTNATHIGSFLNTNSISNIVVPNTSSVFGGFEFYENAPASISGFVYVDENGSGSVDVTEDGIANVVMQLVGTDDLGNAVNEETTTNSFGFYEFENLRPGQYTVVQQQPEGYLNAIENPGVHGGTATENQIQNIEVLSGQFLQQYNFGEFDNGSLSGYVFVDYDKDKVFDGGDVAIESATITLTGIDFRGNAVSRTTQTDSSGFYEFKDLLAGTYELTETQPTGYTTTYSHAGTFDEEDGVQPENGNQGEDQVSNIQLDHGRIGAGYNFSERLAGNSTGGFDRIVNINGTENDDVIIFRPGVSFHTVTINGVDTLLDASEVLDIRIEGLAGEDVVRVYGTEAVEQVNMYENKSIMRSGGFKVTTGSSETVKMYSGGGYDRAFMWDTYEDDRAKFTQDYTRIWNDEVLYESRGYHRSYVYAERGGEDRAYFFDSKYDDTFKVSHVNARMIGRKFYSWGGDFEKVYGYSQNGGSDTAYFWDSAADNDIFEVQDGFARMRNSSTGMHNVGVGFDKMVGRATKGGSNDRAYFTGSAGDDILVSSPRKTNLVGDGFEFESKKFERIYVSSEGGNDSALLFDSKLDDRFVATPGNARLYNDDYFIRVNGYSDVDAFSSKGGRDRAYFYDSVNDDTLISLEDETRMFGIGFDNTSHGFARNYSHSINGGNDTAFVYDTDGADTFLAQGAISKMYGVGYYNWSNSFEDVQTNFVSASRHDRAIVFGSIDENTIERVGRLANIINTHAAYYVYDVDLHEAEGNIGNDDEAFESIAEDLYAVLPD